MEFETFYIVATYVPNAGEGLKRLSYRVDSWDPDMFDHL
jgi:exonuclease III